MAPEKKDDQAAMDVDDHIVKDKEGKSSQIDIQQELADDVKHAIQLVRRSVEQFEPRFLARALKMTPSLLRRLDNASLRRAISAHAPDTASSEALLSVIPVESMHIEQASPKAEAKGSDVARAEIELFLSYLVFQSVFIRNQQELSKAQKWVQEYVTKSQTYNRRTLDLLTAKFFFWQAKLAEDSDTLASLRPSYTNALRTATVRQDTETQATLINVLLRIYLHLNLFDQAEKLISKTTFPASTSNNQWARFMYYQGRVQATQLNYTEAQNALLNAERKAPQAIAAGTAAFLTEVLKLKIIVDLLMGDIPPKASFRTSAPAAIRPLLRPYEELVSAVRRGDLSSFVSIVKKYEAVFRVDKNLGLIMRLRHNVIKTGIRMISLSYAKISLRDICLKLHVDSEEDAEFVVAKAIRDGVIEATIEHEKGIMKSTECLDVYSTIEPLEAFDQRISFCLGLRNEAVKALRFPTNAHKKELETAQELRERANELKNIGEDELGDEDDDEGDF